MKLMENEEILMEMEPEPRLLVIWFLMTFLGTVAGIAFFILLLTPALGGLFEMFSNAKDNLLSFWLLMGIGIAFFIVIVIFVYCIYLRRTYRYTITNRRIIFCGGILRRVQRSVPYHKINVVEMSQTIIERMLGISSLGIYTPGTGSMGRSSSGRPPEIAFVGLTDTRTPVGAINNLLSQVKITGD